MAFGGFRPLAPVGPSSHRPVGPIGLISTFGRDARDVAEAVAKGCNYLLVRPRRQPGFLPGVRQVVRLRRDDVVLGLESGARGPLELRWRLELALRRAGTDHFDFLLLGKDEQRWARAFIAQARQLRDKGKIRFVAVAYETAPDAKLAAIANDDIVEVLHARVNAIRPEPPSAAAARTRQVGLVALNAAAYGALLRPFDGEARVPTVADCYRFALSQPGVRVCLASAPTVPELDAALRALARGPMNEDELAWMRKVGKRAMQTGVPAQAPKSCGLTQTNEIPAFLIP